ncbi:MAG: hypothetical protein ACTHMI_06595 [Mucilaginibacter sp.]
MLNQVKNIFRIAVLLALLPTGNAAAQARRFKPKPPGVPSELQVTPYKTTMIANG